MGVPNDNIKAAQWFFDAAQHDYGPAQAQLSRMHVLGEGVPRDIGEAIMWAELAASKDHDLGKKYREFFENQFPSEVIAEGKRRASKCTKNWYLRC